jgi:hypothetical protein
MCSRSTRASREACPASARSASHPRRRCRRRVQLAEFVERVAAPSLGFDADQRRLSMPESPSRRTPSSSRACAGTCATRSVAGIPPVVASGASGRGGAVRRDGNPVRDYLAFREAFPFARVRHCRSPSGSSSISAGGTPDAPRTRRTGSSPTMTARHAGGAPGRTSRARSADALADHPCCRHSRRRRWAVRESTPPYVPFTDPPTLDHTYVQWLLAKVGQHLGCRVWIAANDWRREWGGERLARSACRACRSSVWRPIRSGSCR